MIIRLKKRNLLFGTIFLLLSPAIYAQVTIGSGSPPAKGSLLQLKDKESVPAGGINSTTGGLTLPRVSLQNSTDISVYSFPKGITPEELGTMKAELTGTIVYNLNTTEDLNKGIYEWDGRNWNFLQNVTPTVGSTIRKVLYKGANADESQILTIGPFSFRISNGTQRPQMKLTTAPNQSVTYYLHFGQYWDQFTDSSNSLNGYSYDLLSLTFAPTDYGWKEIISSGMSTAERNEVWLADYENNNLYNIQFLILGSGTNNVFGILATEY